MIRNVIFALALLASPAAIAQELPIFDAHIHYSHDAVLLVPPAQVAKILREAGVKKALVSSSDDDGTQKLKAAAPDIVVPALRPYRQRGEIGSWMHDPTVIEYLEDRLARFEVLWAHSGFARPEEVADALATYPKLWADLAYRSDMAGAGGLDPSWEEAFTAHPDRFMVGTDTFAPERWYYVGPHAASTRQWLSYLPEDTARKIAFENAEAMLAAK